MHCQIQKNIKFSNKVSDLYLTYCHGITMKQKLQTCGEVKGEVETILPSNLVIVALQGKWKSWVIGFNRVVYFYADCLPSKFMVSRLQCSNAEEGPETESSNERQP